MDPRSKLFQAEVSVTAILNVIDDYTSRHPNPFWSITPDELRSRLITAANGRERMMFGEAVRVLDGAYTPKMHGQANKGLTWIKDHWKILARSSF